jgi:MoaA/NifB/PqqE/SkfB family radical SAM enzyme
MIELINKLPKYWISRNTNLLIPMPINYSLGLTYHCQARCATCRIYERTNVDEMKVDEWKKIFQNIGNSPYWITFTGGEPFLYKDIVEVFYWLNEYCKPVIVNIPTNGQLYERILDSIWQILKMKRSKTQIIVNVSLDHYIAEKNDEIRGIRGYFKQAVNTINALQEHKDLTVGIHTVISKFNVNEISNISIQLNGLLNDPTHYITEIAEHRKELGTMDVDITPSNEDYYHAASWLDFTSKYQKKTLIRAFRLNYYQNVVKWNNSKWHMPCYAGYASCQITPEGNVVPCCIKYSNMGNLRSYNYDFKKLWNNPTAQVIRNDVKKCEGCQLANANYTNSLFNIPTLIKVASKLI